MDVHEYKAKYGHSGSDVRSGQSLFYLLSFVNNGSARHILRCKDEGEWKSVGISVPTSSRFGVIAAPVGCCVCRGPGTMRTKTVLVLGSVRKGGTKNNRYLVSW